jgi:hypothetical protein
VEIFEPVCSESGNFEALDFQNCNCFFSQKKYMNARTTLGEQVVMIISPKIVKILEIKSFKVASCHVGTQKISPGRCDLNFWSSL